ncbi:MAG: acetylornithine carbamoyltransferase, partial [Xanthomonadales bacterium]|nr:acetylornithine carbamoyltransferase [Xanthomonadales bacterium]
MMYKNFINTEDWSKSEIEGLIDVAKQLKDSPFHQNFKNKSFALLFLNPSMRTRTSFELGIQQLGGTAIVLQPGKDAWGIEFEE